MGIAISIVAIVCVIALIATYIIFRQEENKYPEEGNSIENEMKRSHEYEKKSISSSIRKLSWVYVVVIALSFIWLAVYILSL